MHTSNPFTTALFLLATTANAYNLYFYLGSECNGEETAVVTDFSTPDVCSVRLPLSPLSLIRANRQLTSAAFL